MENHLHNNNPNLQVATFIFVINVDQQNNTSSPSPATPRESHTHSLSHHSILNFIIPILLGFIQVKFEGTQLSVFGTHSILVGISVAAILSYCTVCIAQPHFPNLSRPLQLMSMLSASTLVASLVSILLHPINWELLVSYLVSQFLLLTIPILLWKRFPDYGRPQPPTSPIPMSRTSS